MCGHEPGGRRIRGAPGGRRLHSSGRSGSLNEFSVDLNEFSVDLNEFSVDLNEFSADLNDFYYGSAEHHHDAGFGGVLR